MKASSLKKESKSIEKICEMIKSISESDNSNYKAFIPHYTYVSPLVITELISNGYKVYEGILMNNDKGLIIEW